MHYPNINKNDPKVRLALLNTHNNKCFYSSIPLSYDEMDVDHIIPENIATDNEKLIKYLEELNLPLSFSLNCFQNLVPTTRTANRRKSGSLFDIKNARFYLSLTHQKLQKFEKELLTAEASAKSSKLRQTIDLLTNEAPYYEEVVDIKENYCIFSKKHVRLEANLPLYPNLTGSCLITFKSVLLRDCMITFGHKEIIATLFAGVESGSNYDIRGFYVGTYETKHFVQLGNNRFALTADELEELCWTLDELEKIYIRNVKEIENIYGIRHFTKSPYNERYFQLLRITRNLWDQLVDFSEIFDSSKGSSKWHVFDHSYNSLKISGGVNNSDTSPGYHSIIYPEPVEDTIDIYNRSYDDKLWLSWKPIEFLQKGIIDDYSSNNLWSAQKTHDWLIEELIPYAVYFFEKRKNWLKKAPKENVPRSFALNFDSESYFISGRFRYKCDIYKLSSVKDCLQIIGVLQQHFHVERNVYLKVSDVRPLCEKIIEYLKKDPLKNYGYVLRNLSYFGSSNREQLVSALAKYIENIQDGDCSSSEIDHMLRSILDLIEKGKLSIDAQEAVSLSHSLKGLCKIMENSNDIRRIAKY